jgi:hypothetical protein
VFLARDVLTRDLLLFFAHLRLKESGQASRSYRRYLMIDSGASQSLINEICLALLFQEAFNGFSGA